MVMRTAYSKGGHSIKNWVALLIQFVSERMKREEGPAPGSTCKFFFLVGGSPSIVKVWESGFYAKYPFLVPICGITGAV